MKKKVMLCLLCVILVLGILPCGMYEAKAAPVMPTNVQEAFANLKGYQCYSGLVTTNSGESPLIVFVDDLGIGERLYASTIDKILTYTTDVFDLIPSNSDADYRLKANNPANTILDIHLDENGKVSSIDFSYDQSEKKINGTINPVSNPLKQNDIYGMFYEKYFIEENGKTTEVICKDGKMLLNDGVSTPTELTPFEFAVKCSDDKMAVVSLLEAENSSEKIIFPNVFLCNLKDNKVDSIRFSTSENPVPHYEDISTLNYDSSREASNFLSAGLVNSSKEELFKAILTSNEQEQVKAGINASIWLEAKDIASSVSNNDKSLAEKALPTGFKTGKYIDLNLYKQVGDVASEKVSECPGGKVTLHMEIPEDIKDKESYKIIRVHDGEAEVIDASVTQSGKDELIFETEKFSTYVIAYSDNATTSGLTKGSGAKTGDIMFVFMIALVFVVALAGVVYNKKRAYC